MAKKRIGGGFSRKALCALTSFALACGLIGVAPLAAFADTADATGSWSDAAAQANSPAYAPYSSDGAAAAAANAGGNYPAAYDLRDYGVVTPVKLQNPWGTCWGFAAIAASETSILSEMGTTYDAFSLDLSERQLAYFAYSDAPGFALDQEGEGAYNTSGDPNFMYNLGGWMVYATTMFSAGIGPLSEDLIPYRNEEGIVVCEVLKDNTVTYEYLTQAQIEEKQAQGFTVTPQYYASTYPDPNDPSKTLSTDWTLDTEDPESEYFGLWLASSYELEESNILPDMTMFDQNGVYKGFNQESMDAVKWELMSGRAVSMAFCADTSMPGQPEAESQFISEDWAHYTYMPQQANHAVTIVGWDDNYPKENFLESSKVNPNVQQPPANGAWLVKNSWGSETEDFPNKSAWGIEDDEGNHTGYFWLSYYDQSITMLETFNYDLESYTTEEEFAIDQYNYLIAGNTLVNSYDAPAPAANVFTAMEDTIIRTMTCETTKPNTTVTYELYLLDDDDANPADGTPVAKEKDTYDYGGFHRMTLPEEDWVPVREGQRYAVVVTQLCNDDGKYYQSVAMNNAKMKDEDIRKTEEAYRQFFESILFMQYYNELLEKYKGESMSEEEASAKAEEEAWIEVQKPAVKDLIAQMVKQQVAGITQTYFKGIVNEGESFTFTPSDAASARDVEGEGEGAQAPPSGWDAEGGWTDWSEVVAGLPENMVYDNFPIKAYADYRDWADVATLDDLAYAVEATSADLASVTVSADGTDVSKDAQWVSRADYDAFAAAVAAARDLLAAAGDDYANSLAPTTPGQEETEAALDALDAAMKAFQDAKSFGTKDGGGSGGGTGDEGDSGTAGGDGDGDDGALADGGGKDGASLSKTADFAPYATAASAVAVALAAAVMLAARKRAA